MAVLEKQTRLAPRPLLTERRELLRLLRRWPHHAPRENATRSPARVTCIAALTAIETIAAHPENSQKWLFSRSRRG
jgi:hypothetical protein